MAIFVHENPYSIVQEIVRGLVSYCKSISFRTVAPIIVRTDVMSKETIYPSSLSDMIEVHVAIVVLVLLPSNVIVKWNTCTRDKCHSSVIVKMKRPFSGYRRDCPHADGQWKAEIHERILTDTLSSRVLCESQESALQEAVFMEPFTLAD